MKIEPNLPTISMAWLNKNRQNGSNKNTTGSIRPIAGRRASVASCRNVFDINGQVEEVGFDYLPHLQTVHRDGSRAPHGIIEDGQEAGPSGINVNNHGLNADDEDRLSIFSVSTNFDSDDDAEHSENCVGSMEAVEMEISGRNGGKIFI